MFGIYHEVSTIDGKALSLLRRVFAHYLAVRGIAPDCEEAAGAGKILIRSYERGVRGDEDLLHAMLEAANRQAADMRPDGWKTEKWGISED